MSSPLPLTPGTSGCTAAMEQSTSSKLTSPQVFCRTPQGRSVRSWAYVHGLAREARARRICGPLAITLSERSVAKENGRFEQPQGEFG
eukprot:3997351-Pleurochrysis_carterae.AAC.1